ncbi:dynein light chain Tctex-type 5-like [Corticium candelabrum]|uniref:dynein light chain Tctex-type 5-like n=1 Tax=Corticium candelabrum TaxID=121492 RepID=UPI002E2760E1|nr:dynein light chain Tctex-type 5-like [Corticium candelabrum]
MDTPTGKRLSNAKSAPPSLPRGDTHQPSRRLSSPSRRQSATDQRRLTRSRVSFDDGRNREGHREGHKPSDGVEKQTSQPNTYQLEPQRQFPVNRATAIIKEKLHKVLDGVEYDASTCSHLCKSLADDLKVEIRDLNLPRYKIVSSCCIGDMSCTGLLVASRCAWDKERDNYASYTYQSKTLFATATVYAVYFA